MKKKIFGGVALFTLIIAASFNVNIKTQENKSNISLGNIEALASENSSSDDEKYCAKTWIVTPRTPSSDSAPGYNCSSGGSSSCICK